MNPAGQPRNSDAPLQDVGLQNSIATRDNTVASTPSSKASAEGSSARGITNPPPTIKIISMGFEHDVVVDDNAALPELYIVPRVSLASYTKCTGGCGSSWRRKQDAPWWSRNKKPWCSACSAGSVLTLGAWLPLDYGPTWLELLATEKASFLVAIPPPSNDYYFVNCGAIEILPPVPCRPEVKEAFWSGKYGPVSMKIVRQALPPPALNYDLMSQLPPDAPLPGASFPSMQPPNAACTNTGIRPPSAASTSVVYPMHGVQPRPPPAAQPSVRPNPALGSVRRNSLVPELGTLMQEGVEAKFRGFAVQPPPPRPSKARARPPPMSQEPKLDDQRSCVADIKPKLIKEKAEEKEEVQGKEKCIKDEDVVALDEQEEEKDGSDSPENWYGSIYRVEGDFFADQYSTNSMTVLCNDIVYIRDEDIDGNANGWVFAAKCEVEGERSTGKSEGWVPISYLRKIEDF